MSFYVVPIIGTGKFPDTFRPKYLGDTAVPFQDGIPYDFCPLDDTGVVYAQTSVVQDAFLAAQPDVQVIPPLDEQVGAGRLNTVRNRLEALNIPAQWVTASHTFRNVMRVVVGMAQLIHVTEGLGNKLRVPGNLDLRMNQIPADKRATLQQGADILGLDRSGVTAITTVREVLRILGEQFMAGRGVSLGDL